MDSFKALYLRSVYWFGLVSGGSVGHTSGVINALRKKGVLEVVSNDALSGVTGPVTIVPPLRLPGLPQGLQEVLYNLKLLFCVPGVKGCRFLYQRYSGYSFAGALLARRHKVPLVLEFNSSDLWKEIHWPIEYAGLKKVLNFVYKYVVKLPLLYLLESFNLRCADLVVVVSKTLEESLLRRGVPPEKILVNPNGIDPQIYSPAVDGTAVKRCYDLEGKVVVGFIGTFGQWHGALEMVRAIGRFFEKHPEKVETVRFLLIGEGLLFDQCREIIAAGPFARCVIFTGGISQGEGPRHLAACDLFLSPHIPNPDGSPFFGSPTKLFEYMGMGRGIIASELGQIGELIVDGHSGLLVPPGDVEKLAGAIFRLVEDERLRRSLGEHARDRVLEAHTWEHHVERTLERLPNRD